MAIETWIFRGTKPVLWRIPVRVFQAERNDVRRYLRKETRSRLNFEPAVHLLQCQRDALYEFFETQNAIEYVLGQWRLRYSWKDTDPILRKMGAIPASSENPEEHLVWGPRRPPGGEMTAEQAETQKWLEEMLAAGTGESIEQLAYFWRAFRLHIANTLLNKEQPVDFFWFKLHNCPLRVGWHELPDMDRRKPPKEPKTILRRVLGNDKMLAFDVDGDHCLRHIEIEHTDEWWKLVRHVEGKRRYKMGVKLYAERFQDSLERFALTAWRLHCRWYAEMAQDGLCRVVYRPGGGFRFVWDPLARSVRRTPWKRGKAPRVANHRHLKDAIQRVTKSLPGAHGRVSAVSDLRPPSEAVRSPEDAGPGSPVDQPADRPGGSDGMLVPISPEELVFQREVLASRAGSDDDGLAG